eukprot:TRINITY_DN17487_c0_g1_i1.p1 TRINITY_DN17487_c0_g1~~TRINITY_DN17487_c0_g1_i1.p1  ORF type:complete len:133 (+),score=27.32 TRINITY_DN17487_c0_g1_i1:63-461(+)
MCIRDRYMGAEENTVELRSQLEKQIGVNTNLSAELKQVKMELDERSLSRKQTESNFSVAGLTPDGRTLSHYEAFFVLNVQSAKLNSPKMEDVMHVDTQGWFELALRAKVPFNQWYLWIFNRLHERLSSRNAR